jgi:hypothetical protein
MPSRQETEKPAEVLQHARAPFRGPQSEDPDSAGQSVKVFSPIIVASSELVFPVRRLAPDGLEAWKQVIERGYEGYVAKDEGSQYEDGWRRGSPAQRPVLMAVPTWGRSGSGSGS